MLNGSAGAIKMETAFHRRCVSASLAVRGASLGDNATASFAGTTRPGVPHGLALARAKFVDVVPAVIADTTSHGPGVACTAPQVRSHRHRWNPVRAAPFR